MRTSITLMVTSKDVAFIKKLFNNNKEQLERLIMFERTRSLKQNYTRSLKEINNIIEQLNKYQ